jgi:hypothetical protein
MSVYLLHGVVDHWRKGASAFRNYVPRKSLESFLRNRERPFVSWNTLRTEGDVLTVDDATRAGAEACRFARQLGHDVIFFVNPLQIITGEPYFFSLLDALIDAHRATIVEYHGEQFDLRDSAELHRFRLTAKANLMVQPAEDSLRATEALAKVLGAPGTRVGDHEVPIGFEELRELHRLGVQIENHGWSHQEISALREAEFAEHVTKGRDWLRQVLEVDSRLYAVPFGLTDIPPAWHPLVGSTYFLADYRLPLIQLGPKSWNRRDLSATLQEL